MHSTTDNCCNWWPWLTSSLMLHQHLDQHLINSLLIISRLIRIDRHSFDTHWHVCKKSVDSQLTVDQDKLIECQPSVNRGVNWISIEYQLLVLIEDIYWHSTVDAFSTQNLTNMHWALIYSWYDVINSDACRTHLIWFHWNNGAQCKDEWMDILHVKVVSGNSIRYWVISQFLLCRKKTLIMLCWLMQPYSPNYNKWWWYEKF